MPEVRAGGTVRSQVPMAQGALYGRGHHSRVEQPGPRCTSAPAYAPWASPAFASMGYAKSWPGEIHEAISGRF